MLDFALYTALSLTITGHLQLRLYAFILAINDTLPPPIFAYFIAPLFQQYIKLPLQDIMEPRPVVCRFEGQEV